jgi:hypothetical protein
MRIKYLFAEGCKEWDKGLKELEKALKDLNLNEKVEVIKLLTVKDAEKYDFIGSPTIRLNEAELGREEWKITERGTEIREKKPTLSCRIYGFKGKVYQYPPKEMIKDFIRTYAVWKETDKGSDSEGPKHM